MSLEYDLPRTFNNFDEMREWVWNQFKRTEEEFNQGREAHYLKELHEEPNKLILGMTVLADGTDWNPGSGAGVYSYYGGAWHKLG